METTLEPAITPFDILGFLSRRRILMTWVFIAAFLVGLLIVLLIPSVYRSTATILIEQQEIPEELVRSTVTSFADQRIETIAQRVMTTSNLWSIIEKFNLYVDRRDRDPREEIIEKMRKEIDRHVISADVVDPRSGRPVQATIAFSLAFDAESPAIAQRVANELSSLFLKENIRTRSDMAQEAEKFLSEEAEHVRDQLNVAGEQLAEFKKANAEALPELQTLNITTMQRIEQDLREVERDISSLDERRAFLEGELARLDPNDRMITDSGAAVMSPLGRLKMLQTQRLQLMSQYSVDHPDVQRTEREIESLKKELGYGDDSAIDAQQVIVARNALESARERYGESHPEIKRLQRELEIAQSAAEENSKRPLSESKSKLFMPNSPAYLETRANMNALEVQYKKLQEKRVQLRAERDNYEKRMVSAPEVEKKYNEFIRELETLRVKYNEIKAKQAQAKLAKSLETEQKGEHFTLIDPPQLPETPVKPKRMMLSVIVFVMSAMLAIGFGYLLEMMDKSIKDVSTIERLAGHAPLAVIPYIETDEELNRERHKWTAALIAAFVAILLIVMAIHFFYRPLDVLYYILMRKVGL